MKLFANSIVFLTGTLLVISAQAQTSYELTCRAKAKEIATQTYSSCVSESRNAQIDQIRKDYQKQLADLKAKYDRELKKVSGGKSGLNSSGSKSGPAMSAATGSTPKPTKGVAKSLPTRKESKSQAAVIQEVNSDKTVINSDSTTPGVDEITSQNDAQGDLKIQLVPATGNEDKTAATLDEQEL